MSNGATEQEQQQEVVEAASEAATETVKETAKETNGPAREHYANNAELVDAIKGLPEAVANAVKEVIPTPPKPAPKPREAQQQKQTETPPPAETKPGKKSFVEWWFGQ
jgi:hypothetical protein